MKTAGYTLLELIVVITVLGVLAVSAYSRFQGTDGIAEYSYQARLVSALRNMQTRAMQDTRPGYCYQINLNTTAPAFGPPTLAYSPGGGAAQQAQSCSTSIDYSTPEYLRTSQTDMSDDNLLLSALDGGSAVDHIGFDGLGRPVDNAQQAICTGSSGCTLTVTGTASARVCVASEGYIYAC
ncbi:type II secretion system protein [Lacimicrobium alkaliphilum]|uniref:MSHA pilin protein MshC n=1 Tax=Lacimicrobium alkaliphilum TaxID=1526571 RepID=A0ABQ1RAD2_9ALTE|nr:prepilin-type N-terminal cleavage/methylation domain-containing protein [Lacimicrobium alkaliphilum]GGD61888.1 MSHA pilin protein MshC [Lacimicrobium alkaliphilum]